ncbi:MAG: NAD+ synthase [Magnetococcales bacterium]|nr:NAD+ synthase [Magnetococcales bacterium]NGZ27012.1 NAD+ synthase [Magnetococcales bacterium]
MEPFTLALAQMNPHVGALETNLQTMLELAAQAREQGCDLLVYPELVLCGYPPEDLLLKPAFLARLRTCEEKLHQGLQQLGMDAIYGSPRLHEDKLVNAGVLFAQGREVGFAIKQHLPNYGVFDERRYFHPGRESHVLTYRGWPFGITICEDMWHAGNPLSQLVAEGSRFTINLNASPYHVGKQNEREEIARQRVKESALPLLYVNLVGGQDELVFDGASFILDHQGEVVLRGSQFDQQILAVQVTPDDGGARFTPLSTYPVLPVLDRDKEIYRALCLGLADYVRKNGFDGVVLGLSGGIDSAITAAICADALGPHRVETVMMPSPFTSRESLEDATEVACRLGVKLTTIPIGPLFEQFKEQLAPVFAGRGEDVTEENIQPRIRATLLMAISNKNGSLLVTTGNKSEMSVGYATLYGDMAGGFSVLKDLLKETVYSLSYARNLWAVEENFLPPIPESILVKAPSAELKPDQKDSDSLPPYPVLDQILKLYVEEEKGLADIVATGIPHQVVHDVIRLVDRNEYKRRQSPPGVRITHRAFGKDRRYPITNGFRLH